ncbi:guanine nucleotide-binding protein G(I)/G(S)/G(O) subunit gamma-2 isoform X3 [Canis lupus familiaris]|uniref:guanine nucleotide-binding protein G(I)/G(S)/G(O) subunit gamma-2 isoform X3 n=1 Tax=Canis lupus familiaris TaxID=9615 RepID=UPI0015F15233|nr:guanine nucleotide-binding protein G(I)/G(S)/G(O) subunit gamma-2 isoform X3 [Canis lupus familiaris]
MTEDKAGWGLVPGLQAPRLHTHSAQRRPLGGSSCSCCAGRAAPGSLLARLPGSQAPAPRTRTRTRTRALPPAAGPRPQPRSASEPQALGTEEASPRHVHLNLFTEKS